MATNNKEAVQITPREFAIYRHIWKLEAPEVGKLDAYFLLRCTVGELEAKLDCKSHRSKDLLEVQGSIYEVVELDCKIAGLQEDQELLLSFRKQEYSRLHICLVKVPAGGAVIKKATVRHINDMERG